MESPLSSDFRTTDAGEAEQHLRDQYGALRLSTDRVDFTQSVRGDAAFAVTELHYGGRFEVGGELDLVTVGLVATGFGYEVGSETGWSGSQPVLFQPDQPLRCHIEDVTLRSVTFGAAELRWSVGALLATDAERIRFGSARPRSPEFGAAWGSLLRDATRDAGDSVLVQADLRSTATRMLIETFPLADAALDRRAHGVALWSGYRRAADFIDEHASLPVTVADIAAAARLSGADLDAAFRTHSPHADSARAHLRRVRLDAARRDLISGDPLTTTLTDVARRWGFASTTSFARHYRRAYGAWPRRALRG